MKKLIPIFMLSALFMFMSCDSTDEGPVGTEGSFFKDARGGIITFRGVNMAGDSKVPDFMPIKNPDLLDPLPQWGINVIRFLFTWEAYEAAEGDYNSEYMEYYKNVIDWAWERGIRVIVDFHQDAFSRYQIHGCGEGFPMWAVPPEVSLDTPCNDSSCIIWGAEMIWDFDMHTCWNRFYSDTYGVRTRFLAMVDSVSEELGEHPGVLGYDILNEPWGNEITEIAPLYEDAARIIRNHDTDSIIFVSPHALISAGSDSEMPAMSFDNYAYAPHYYDPSIITINMWLGTSPDSNLDKQKAKADGWGVPVFWGEFGVNATALYGRDYMDAFYDWLDRYNASGAQWNYTPGWTPEKYDGFNDENLSIVDNDGDLRANFRIRPYAARIAGTPISFQTQWDGSDLVKVSLEWDHDSTLGETKIFLPREALFNGDKYTIETSGSSLSCAYDDDGMYLIITSSVSERKSLTVAATEF